MFGGTDRFLLLCGPAESLPFPECYRPGLGMGRHRFGLQPQSERAGGRRRCIIILNGLLLQWRSSSLVLANEKLLAGFQREACPRGTFASVALSASWAEFI